jgi:pimeloyl-ACP methyl ester carboxylesterase
MRQACDHLIRMDTRFKRQLFLFLITFSLVNLVVADDSSTEITSGTLSGSIYSIAKPDNWNKNLLIFAHGYRPAELPLSASIDPQQPMYSSLLASGWMVATTSYRRNGIIISDAIDDLEILRKHIVKLHGSPARILLMGDSMGGAIGTIMAESFADDYDGVLAVGAALRAGNADPGQSLNHNPLIPLIFLSNQDEVEGPAEYVQLASDSAIAPAVWTVARDGHVNVNDSEREAALVALLAFVENGDIERDKDGTIAMQFEGTAAQISDQGAQGEITDVTNAFGNFFSNYVANDLKRLGIERDSYFHLAAGEHELRVFWGATYGDVKEGEWVAFISPQGNLMFARNMQNACKTINCKENDQLMLSK